MKRAVTFFLALILVLGLAIPAFAEEAPAPAAVPKLTLTADKATLAPGETVKVTLTLDQALSDLNNFQFNVLFDAAWFELTGSTVGADTTKVSAPRKDERRTGADCITVSGLSTTGDKVSLAAGQVAELTFKALDTAQVGQASFTVTTQALPQYADPTQPVELTLVNEATVTITEASAVMKGDVTGDGKINYKDALAVYNYLIGARTLEGNAFTAADVNGDSKVNYKDALKLYNYISGAITTL